LDNNTLT